MMVMVVVVVAVPARRIAVPLLADPGPRRRAQIEARPDDPEEKDEAYHGSNDDAGNGSAAEARVVVVVAVVRDHGYGGGCGLSLDEVWSGHGCGYEGGWREELLYESAGVRGRWRRCHGLRKMADVRRCLCMILIFVGWNGS